MSKKRRRGQVCRHKLPYDEEIESKFVKRKAVPVVLDQPENEQQQLQQQQQQQDQQQQIQQQQIQQQQIQDQPQQQQIQDQPQQQQIQEQQDQQLQEQQDQQLQLEMTSQEPILIQEEKPIQEQQLQLEMTVHKEPILIQAQKLHIIYSRTCSHGTDNLYRNFNTCSRLICNRRSNRSPQHSTIGVSSTTYFCRRTVEHIVRR